MIIVEIQAYSCVLHLFSFILYLLLLNTFKIISDGECCNSAELPLRVN
jgi:hypothetical protein